MFERSIEAQVGSPEAFSRGMKLATSGQVGALDIRATDDEGTVTVEAPVRGSGNNSYTVNLALNPGTEEVLMADCTCPDFAEQPGLCKHAIAVTLVYGISYAPAAPEPSPREPEQPAVPNSVKPATDTPSPREPEQPAAPYSIEPTADTPIPRHATPATRRAAPTDASAHPSPAPATQRNRASSRAPRSHASATQTSFQITDLVQAYANRAQRAARHTPAAAPAIPQAEEPADLTCIIAKEADAPFGTGPYNNDNRWRLGLKITRGKTCYVVKRIDELVQAWQVGAHYAYGKNLAFVHRPEAFAEHANALLEIIAGIVDAQRSLFDTYQGPFGSDAGSARSLKMLPLSSHQLADILNRETGRTIIYEYDEAGSVLHGKNAAKHHKHTIPVKDADPLLAVTIAAIDEDEGNGYRLIIDPGNADYLPAGERSFLIAHDAVYRTSADFTRDLGPFCANTLPLARPLQIAVSDMPAFCSAVLPALREHTQLQEAPDLDRYLPGKPLFSFYIGEDEPRITCHAQVDYDGRTVGLFDDVRPKGPVRDIAAEIGAQQMVSAYFPQGKTATPVYDLRAASVERVYGGGQAADDTEPCFDKNDDARYYALFSEGLDQLAHIGEVYLSERLRHVRAVSAPRVRIQVEASDGALNLRMDASELSNEELLSYLASYRRKQRYVRLDDGAIMALTGAIAQAAELADDLGLNDEELVAGTAQLPANRTLFVDALAKQADALTFDRNARFRSIVRDFETIADADIAAPQSLNARLRPYQEEGFRWLSVLARTGFGGILADDMGLGKTLQTIAYFCSVKEQGATDPALVVCPASLVYNWMAELSRFAPGLRAQAVLGPQTARHAIIASSGAYDVLVTSYDLLKRDIDCYESAPFSSMVIDEAQYIKNPGTKAAKSVKRIRAHARFALTGTPIENRLTELWSIFDFLMPGALSTQDEFAHRFAMPIANGDTKAAEQLQRLVGPFILRRLKRDVLRDLPEKNESIVYAQMEGEQAKLYRANASKLARSLSKQKPEEFSASKIQVLAELTRLRQIACDPRLVYEDYQGGSAKLDTCCELIGNALDGGHRILLFSQFTSLFPLIEERLREKKAAYLELTGTTSKQERSRLVERFQAGEAPVFLISLKAGGVGLNLTAADIVIHYDPWWNLAAQNQATDRAHRIGQKREVSVFRLIAKDTIEEGIADMQQSKQHLADAVIGSENVSSATLTREDLLALLASE